MFQNFFRQNRLDPRQTSALDVARLPDMIFVDDQGASARLKLSQAAPRIAAIAGYLRRNLPPSSAVGLMARSGPDLVINWLACLATGMEPLVMQYPTKKQSRAYWADSVRNTVALTGLKLVVADDLCAGLGLAEIVPVAGQRVLDELPDGPARGLQINSFGIIQLSSGTTGYRKAVRFDSEQLVRHVQDYNRILGLTSSDRIVSWLPLYHDMGYIACFVMPLLLGVDVVMLDPMDWVANPDLLYAAIERHAGTVCYMPNFGFEVMARCSPRNLPTMRWWIACSEPVSAATANRFLGSVGAPDQSFAACYAMAENVFAVSIRRGIATRRIEAADVVSCGTAIPNVALKLVDGEVWVRSPASISAYVGGQDVRDADGYYATGDLGELHGGELYITGRKRDLLIQAGRKYMLSDIDLLLNELYPEVRGRAAALADFDERLGTQKPVVLIEAQDFLIRQDQTEIADALVSRLGLEQIEVHHVPPRFLTKTSSGKINRGKSLEHWRLVQNKGRAGAPVIDPVTELRDQFPTVARDQPVGRVLDSLSTTVLRMILASAGLRYERAMSLEQIEAALATAGGGLMRPAEAEVIKVVSLADLRTVGRVTEHHLDLLAKALGSPVEFEHICLPPSPVLLSDLVFNEYFQPRLDQKDFVHVTRALDSLRSASLIIVDDVAEMVFPPQQVYAALSHNLERDSDTDLVAVRWQDYARRHDRLPLTLVAGSDLPPQGRTQTLAHLSAYLDRPIFRVAARPELACFTEGWDVTVSNETPGLPDCLGIVPPRNLIEALVRWIGRLGKPLVKAPPSRGARFQVSDLGHYCSHLANRDSVDTVLSAFDSFCIVGQPGSVPHIQRELARIAKPHVMVSSYAPEALQTLADPFDCLLICGSMGDYPLSMPVAEIMATAHTPAAMRNVDRPGLDTLKFQVNAVDARPSGTDWFSSQPLDRTWNLAAWEAAWMAHGRVVVAPWHTHVLKARNHLQAGELAEAEQEARLATEVSRGEATPFRMMSNVCFRLGRMDESLMWAARAIEADPDDSSSYAQQAQAFIKQGRFEEAERAGRQAIETGGRDAANLHRLSVTLGRIGKLDEAIDLADQAIALDPFGPGQHEQKASLHLQRGEITLAEEACEHGLSYLKDDPTILRRLSLIAHRLGQTERSLDLIVRSIAGEPDFCWSYDHQSHLLSSLGDLNGAKSAVMMALEKGPQEPNILRRASMICMRREEFDEALELIGRAIGFAPDQSQSHDHLVNVLLHTNKLDAAEAACGAALERFPSEAVLHVRMSMIEAKQGKARAALESINRAILLEPTNPWAYHHLSHLLRGRKDYRSAEDAIDRAIQLAPGNANLETYRNRLRRERESAEAAMLDHAGV